MVWLPWFVPLPCKHGYVDSQFVEEMAFPVAIAHFIPLQLQGVDSPWMWHSVTPHNTAAPAGCPALFREECVPFGLPITKDLRKLREDLTRVVLVDNSAKSFWLQPENGLLVCDWDGTNASDQELDRVKDNLLQLLDMDDVRPALRRKPPDAPGDAVDLRLVIIAVALGCWLVSQSQ
ncbi:unnamed protein product [Durusdinium trenchii]|uniref:Mitochondrial import inner membrane translocase subunit TIM50 n=1 Tax=Durusdinium trenchii TaxID=1381693 RepID=A0ABP0I8V3_9DINO